MPGPARAGALIYAKHLAALSGFYQALLGMTLLHADAEHEVIESADMQLVLHAMPAPIAAEVEIEVPPRLRETQAIKLFFTVPSLADAAQRAAALGGGLFGQTYELRGFRARNAHDPEGNILQLREPAI